MKSKLVIAIAISLSMGAFLALSRRQQNPQGSQRCSDCESQEHSVIEGIVVDKNDRPVPYMPVRADSKGGSSGELLSSATNKQGKFVITGVRYGTYLVHAGKDKEGYPWMTGTFWMNEDDAQTVVVSKEKKGIARIVLGERLGRITGIIKGTNGKPIQIAVVKLVVAGKSERFYQTTIEDDGSFVIVVPPEPVILEASATGHETFKSEGLNVSLGAVKKLQIRLYRPH